MTDALIEPDRHAIARGMVIAGVERGLGLTRELAADRPEV
jgi:hypothetical protein